jgi:hypothetical protein
MIYSIKNFILSFEKRKDHRGNSNIQNQACLLALHRDMAEILPTQRKTPNNHSLPSDKSSVIMFQELVSLLY